MERYFELIGKIKDRESGTGTVFKYGKVPDAIYVGKPCNDDNQISIDRLNAGPANLGVACTIRRDMYSSVPVESIVEATADEFI